MLCTLYAENIVPFQCNLKYKERDSKMHEEYEGIISKRWDDKRGEGQNTVCYN